MVTPHDEPAELFDLRMSEQARPLLERVRRFLDEVVAPMERAWFALEAERPERWQFAPGQLELLDGAKAEARRAGLWNFFLPDSDVGGLTNLDYAYIAMELGRHPLASECLNCSAPDTGNMEVLARVGTEEQKRRWLEPLLAGEIRSAYAMTEPDVASSDAKNIALAAVRDGDEYVLNGEKYFISGAGDPRCAVLIVMCRTDPEGSRNEAHSQILVPMDTPGLEVLGPMTIFGHDDSPHGHMHLRFTDVRVPGDNLLLGEGRGFEVAQLRLGPGRIHHCMRAVGAGEEALGLMVERGRDRVAFGRPILQLGKNMEQVSRARIELDACKLMVLKAARAMDVFGTARAQVYVSAVKAMVPEKVCRIVDEAIQIHGATGLSQWTPLADMYVWQRAVRLLDGPDEVHHFVVARDEVSRARPG